MPLSRHDYAALLWGLPSAWRARVATEAFPPGFQNRTSLHALARRDRNALWDTVYSS
jgi:hypothetical protein